MLRRRIRPGSNHIDVALPCLALPLLCPLTTHYLLLATYSLLLVPTTPLLGPPACSLCRPVCSSTHATSTRTRTRTRTTATTPTPTLTPTLTPLSLSLSLARLLRPPSLSHPASCQLPAASCQLPHLPALCSLHDVTAAVPRPPSARHGLSAVPLCACAVPSSPPSPSPSPPSSPRRLCRSSCCPRLPRSAKAACESRQPPSFARPLGSAWQPRLAIRSSPLR